MNWRAVAAVLALLSAPAWAQTAIIYARHDSAAMERLRAAVAVYDTVLIDRTIPAGDQWRAVMARVVTGSPRVLVLWSASAAQSVELGTEWRLALVAGARLIPVLLDDTPLPGELGALQAIDWR